MISREIIFLLIICLIGLCILLVYSRKGTETNSEKTSQNCICAFDLDGTITCGLSRAANAISKCKELNCKIAINTARPTRWYDDLNLNKLGLSESDFDSDFYNGEPFTCSFSGDDCLEESISNTKVKHLHTLSAKWNVNPQRIILFDDQHSNIEKSRQNGFSTIYANHSTCGLPDNVAEQIENILGL